MSNITQLDLGHEQLLEQVSMAWTAEHSSGAASNTHAVDVDRLIATATLSGDSGLRKQLAARLGKTVRDAELSFRSNLGVILLLPTDIATDPIRNLGEPVKGKMPKDRGEFYWRGRMRAYLTKVKKTEGIGSAERLAWMVEQFSVLSQATDHINEYLDRPVVSPIENYFTALPSIEKATRLVESGDYTGNLAEAQKRAAAMRDALDKFLA